MIEGQHLQWHPWNQWVQAFENLECLGLTVFTKVSTTWMYRTCSEEAIRNSFECIKTCSKGLLKVHERFKHLEGQGCSPGFFAVQKMGFFLSTKLHLSTKLWTPPLPPPPFADFVHFVHFVHRNSASKGENADPREATWLRTGGFWYRLEPW